MVITDEDLYVGEALNCIVQLAKIASLTPISFGTGIREVRWIRTC